MKQTISLFIATISAIALSSLPALAKGKKDAGKISGTYGCARFDTNGNGILDPNEKESLLKAFSEGDAALKLLDTNNDGNLDEAELSVIKLPAPAKKK